MKYTKKIYLSLLWIVLGIAFVISDASGILKNDMWVGIGYGWLACGLLQMLKQLRYQKDKDYRELYEVALKDERNMFISSKAWAWAGYGFVLITGIAIIICAALGQAETAKILCLCICLVVFLYWISYMHLKRKY